MSLNDIRSSQLMTAQVCSVNIGRFSCLAYSWRKTCPVQVDFLL